MRHKRRASAFVLGVGVSRNSEQQCHFVYRITRDGSGMSNRAANAARYSFGVTRRFLGVVIAAPFRDLAITMLFHLKATRRLALRLANGFNAGVHQWARRMVSSWCKQEQSDLRVEGVLLWGLATYRPWVTVRT
jgi:hypothetical protein